MQHETEHTHKFLISLIQFHPKNRVHGYFVPDNRPLAQQLTFTFLFQTNSRTQRQVKARRNHNNDQIFHFNLSLHTITILKKEGNSCL